MKTLILAAAISIVTPKDIQTQFEIGCISGFKTTTECSAAGERIFEFVDACEGGNKSLDECVTEALRREGV